MEITKNRQDQKLTIAVSDRGRHHDKQHRLRRGRASVRSESTGKLIALYVLFHLGKKD